VSFQIRGSQLSNRIPVNIRGQISSTNLINTWKASLIKQKYQGVPGKAEQQR